MPRPDRPKSVTISDEADARRHLLEFRDVRELSSEANAAVDVLRKAYTAYFNKRKAEEPGWEERIVLYREAPDGGDPPPPLVLSRREQRWGMIFNPKDWSVDDLLWAAEHGVLEVNLTALRAQGDSTEKDRLLKSGHDGARFTFEFEELAR